MKPGKDRRVRRRAILIGPLLKEGPWASRALEALRLSFGDLVIGVDGGVSAAFQLGIRLDFAIGDWDSLSLRDQKKFLPVIAHRTLPHDKDESDLVHALLAAIESQATEIVCLGVTGGRPDHQLGMLFDLSRLGAGHKTLRSLSVLGEDGEYHFLSPSQPRWDAELPIGTGVSVFAVGGPASGVTLKGMKYPLARAKLLPSSRGLSNQVTKRACQVSLSKGRLVVIVTAQE